MTIALPRTDLNSSRLVRLLSGSALADAPSSKQSLAERLGLWLNYIDASSLFAALNGTAGRSAAEPVEPASATHPVRDEFARLREGLIRSIRNEGARQAGTAHTRWPTPGAGASFASTADFAPYHRYYLAHQRDMEASIGPLRAKVRAVLAAHSPALQRLAAVDAALDAALSDRERSVLASVPVRLAKRFDQLRTAHPATRGAAPAADDADPWTPSGGWLAVFRTEMRDALLAELDLRLQPVTGLIEALGHEATRQP